MTRRQLIETGSAGGALLALATLGYSLFTSEPAGAPDPEFRFAVLDERGRSMVAAIGAALLAGALPAGGPEYRAAVRQVVRGVDAAIANLAPATQTELRQLLALLAFPPTRALVAGVWSPWSTARPDDVDAFLERWRFSRAPLLRTGYQALHQLVLAAWYAGPASWPRIGYPGPPAIH